MPKLSRKIKTDLSTLDETAINKVRVVVEAIERFVNIAGIALGLLQYQALTHADEIWNSYTGWLRTRSSEIPSEAVVQSSIQTEFFSSITWGLLPWFRICSRLWSTSVLWGGLELNSPWPPASLPALPSVWQWTIRSTIYGAV